MFPTGYIQRLDQISNVHLLVGLLANLGILNGLIVKTEYQLIGQTVRHYYTLSHPKNDSDVTESVQGYTLQEASFVRQFLCPIFNV